MDRLGCELGTSLMFRANVYHKEVQERGILASFAKLHFLFPKTNKVMVARKLDRRAERCGTLNKYFTRHITTTGAPGHLR